MSSQSAHHAYQASSEPKRRDLLSLIATAGAAIGLGAIAWPLIDFMNPSADVVAGGAPIDIDLSKIEPGQQIVVLWRGAPILIVNRTPAALKTLQAPNLVSLLSDPTSTAHQQPPYADNWHRSIKPTYAVLVGICTHLGCLPEYKPAPDPTTPAPNWLGGYFCPCHGSKYRSRRPGLQKRARAVELACPTLQFRQRQNVAPWREPARTNVRVIVRRSDVATPYKRSRLDSTEQLSSWSAIT